MKLISSRLCRYPMNQQNINIKYIYMFEWTYSFDAFYVQLMILVVAKWMKEHIIGARHI